MVCRLLYFGRHRLPFKCRLPHNTDVIIQQRARAHKSNYNRGVCFCKRDSSSDQTEEASICQMSDTSKTCTFSKTA
eukprot:390790-Amphidinium_carterae.1